MSLEQLGVFDSLSAFLDVLPGEDFYIGTGDDNIHQKESPAHFGSSPTLHHACGKNRHRKNIRAPRGNFGV